MFGFDLEWRLGCFGWSCLLGIQKFRGFFGWRRRGLESRVGRKIGGWLSGEGVVVGCGRGNEGQWRWIEWIGFWRLSGFVLECLERSIF